MRRLVRHAHLLLRLRCDPASCAKPRFSDVGWTDITATTAVANELLTHLGYQPNVAVLSVAITFKALENGDRDIFLGNWMPLQEPTQVAAGEGRQGRGGGDQSRRRAHRLRDLQGRL